MNSRNVETVAFALMLVIIAAVAVSQGQYVTLLSPTVALATGEGSSSATLDDGRVLTTRLAQSVVFVLANGEWKVFHSHRSFPPAQ